MDNDKPKHTMQPLTLDGDGIIRFRQNAIVRRLLTWASIRGCGLNEIAEWDVSTSDREQFAQLIGYSITGYGELYYVSAASAVAAYAAADALRVNSCIGSPSGSACDSRST